MSYKVTVVIETVPVITESTSRSNSQATSLMLGPWESSKSEMKGTFKWNI